LKKGKTIMKASHYFYGSGLSRLTLAIICCGFGAYPLAASASLLPDATTNTPCGSGVTTDQTCYQHNPIVSIFSQAKLSNLTATANIDQLAPYSTYTSASVTYYMELTSSSGFPSIWGFTVPLLVSAIGYTDVGGAPPAIGTSYNHNQATADFRINSGSVFSACAGYGCYTGAQTNFNGGQVGLRPGSSSSGFGGNIFQISLDVRAQTNSNFTSSYAHAWIDPTIQIDPIFLAANPGYSLSFSSNIPAAVVPVPAAAWLFGSGLVGLIGLARRRQI
jgi:hypothetical protein